jgi:two-component system sensor histidine kinase MprB
MSGRPDDPAGAPSTPGRPRRRSWFSRLALRNRMALLVGVAVTAGIAVVAGVALAATSVVLRNAIDDQLVQQAEAAASSTRFSAGPFGRLELSTTGFGLPFQVILADGAIVPPQYPSDTQAQLPVDGSDIAIARSQSGQRLRTVTVGDTKYRVVTVALPVSQNDGAFRAIPSVQLALQLARPMTDVAQTLRELGIVMLLVGVAGVVGSMAVGLLVARAALKPVDAAAAAAEEVARTQDLSALIPVTGSDEVARLAESLNSMLRALESSRARQRQLVDDASHELRTPLTSLRTNIELLIRAEASPHRALPPADRTALLRDVDAQMRELTGLVSELVELARDEAPVEEIERIDLAEIVAVAAARVRRRATAKGITIDVTAAGSLVDGRPSMLERAVTNLLDNAVKFSPPGSVVLVHTRAGQVTVADAGPGIAPEDRPNVFERFYRATTARGLPGSGLGLAIVADAARVHGGTISAEDAPSGGALLRLRLRSVGPPPVAWSSPATTGDVDGPRGGGPTDGGAGETPSGERVWSGDDGAGDDGGGDDVDLADPDDAAGPDDLADPDDPAGPDDPADPDGPAGPDAPPGATSSSASGVKPVEPSRDETGRWTAGSRV